MQLSEFEKKLNQLYLPSDQDFSIIDVPKAQFAMVDGTDPQSPQFKPAIDWLFKLIQPIKQIAKQRMGKAFKHPPLECLFWGEDFGNWRLMIVLPDWADDELFNNCIAQASQKLGTAPASLRKQSFEEGKSVQIMHIGAPKTQAITLEKLHSQFLPANKLTARGHHHEIYLNDANHTAPEQLKTVMRQPVCP
ncbi:MAG: GyrI-like domain-containing protein [Rhizobiales bacterium]|nr:GyrI-like domain-containing protein [Hyphomicrobiales bacterium]NRB13751.1 GyrI-like domain-containing protein [Hyphomicrobiales bacterium]